MWRYFLVAVALTMTVACEKPPKTVRIENVERVFMHERGRYTFLVREDDGVTLTPVSYYEQCRIPEQFVTDVPSGMPAWATYEEDYGGCQRSDRKGIVIHLHDTQQLYTAGWDHGKFGSGITNIIE